MVPDFLLHFVDGYLCHIPVDCSCLRLNLVIRVPIVLFALKQILPTMLTAIVFLWQVAISFS